MGSSVVRIEVDTSELRGLLADLRECEACRAKAVDLVYERGGGLRRLDVQKLYRIRRECEAWTEVRCADETEAAQT